MNKNVLLLFKKYKTETDATATNRGFLYQYLKTLKVWIDDALNNTKNDIFCETEDDIKEVNPDVKSLKFTQVKCYASNLGTIDNEIQKTIYNFFMLTNLYPDYNGQFYFETNTNIKINDDLLKNWHKDQENMGEALITECKLKVKEILEGVVKEKKKSEIKKIEKSITELDPSMSEKKDSLEKEKETVIKEFDQLFGQINDDHHLESFVKSIKWNFEQVKGEEAVRIIKQECEKSLKEYTDKYTYLLLTRLLSEIYLRSANTEVDNRKLNKNLLDQIIEESEQEMAAKIQDFISDSLDQINEKIDGLHDKVDEVKDILGEVPKVPKYNYKKMLDMYSIRIDSFLQEEMPLPFQSEFDKVLINNSYFNDFFEISTWKSKIIEHISSISRDFSSKRFLKEKIDELIKIYKMDLSYEEFKIAMRKKNEWILEELPKDKTTKDIIPLLYRLYVLLDKKYNKVLILTGESGSGKTHLLKTMLSSYQIEKELGYCSIRIPIDIYNIKENGFEEAIKSSLNHFLNTNFSDVTNINDFIIELEKEGFNFRVIFIIDNLQTLCKSNERDYINLKQTIAIYTKYDWISWCLAINEFDQYLIMDNSDFLKKYNYYNHTENNPDLFVNMSQINNENKVCYKILNQYDIDTKEIEQFPRNISNIKMLLNNPLIAHVYANTVNENEKELLNVGYFNFIKSYSDIKKTQMLDRSERNVNRKDLQVQIDKEIVKIVKFLIENRTLTYPIDELNDLLKDKNLESCFTELLSVQLANKVTEEYEDDMEKRTDMNVNFVFKLYWAYKILLQFREEKNWMEFSSWRKSFIDLKDDLLVYEILYLDKDFENNQEVLTQEIVDVLKRDNEKASLLFFGVKTSFDCQGLIFHKLLEEEKLILNKQETFALMYFLKYSEAKGVSNAQKCMLLNKYLDKVSEYDLDGYLKGVCNKLFGLNNQQRLKGCISEFIGCTDTKINRLIGKLAAENFIRVVSNKTYIMKDFIKGNLIKYLCVNLEKIDESMEEKFEKIDENMKKKFENAEVTFIECFLRYLFTSLIELNNDNEFLLHEILLTDNFYYLEQDDDKLKHIGYILRSNSTIAYGSYYKHLHHSKREKFKEQYISIIKNLLNSEVSDYHELAFHFISNTLFYERPNSTLDGDFIPLLKKIYTDKKNRKFNNKRKGFYKKYYHPYIRKN
ncbi:dsDNA nuclease domain-containing protein [Priestia megaterium]|uniref:dsDNA nuclease domain-containing protein n=1 Tax=Priestia megaterium TaxID=1404 RepID=UPI000BA5E185|nr:dsDNA nuclease domain-containing protein [Priestia megaterium]PAK43956.1 hypothetical protein CHH47_27485 [Priestia megaterium]